MKKTRWTDYERYLVLADNSNGRLSSTWAAYLNFKELKNALGMIIKSSGNKYVLSDSGKVYDKKITSTDANNILDNIYECIWNSKTEKLFSVASQLDIKLKTS
jgi:hypothetical protein